MGRRGVETSTPPGVNDFRNGKPHQQQEMLIIFFITFMGIICGGILEIA